MTPLLNLPMGFQVLHPTYEVGGNGADENRFGYNGFFLGVPNSYLAFLPSRHTCLSYPATFPLLHPKLMTVHNGRDCDPGYSSRCVLTRNEIFHIDKF